MELILALAGLAILIVPFVMPIASWVSAQRARRRIDQLEQVVRDQQRHIDALSRQVKDLRPTPVAEPMRETAAARDAPSERARASEPAPAAIPASTPPHAPPIATPPSPPPITTSPVATGLPHPSPATPPPPVPAPPGPAAPLPVSRAAGPPAPAPVASDAARDAARQARDIATAPPASPPDTTRALPVPPPRPPVPPSAPPPPAAPFDWESVIGVKLFSAIAGIALVIAAVFFLRYSIEHGWLQPPVRVAIGIIVAIALLVVCELKVAREYPATANALDAAAIAILFATFFAAHALWGLIPAGVAFALLALVTAIAVLLSIRRESLFIAVLGLLGGFATPALLSTGENRPIPLFAYLLLLNVGLSWVSYTRRWALLGTLTLVFTTLYQWGWVIRFLDVSQLTLAASIFLLFPVATIVALVLARPEPAAGSAEAEDRTFERTALVASALPLMFAVYVATVPAYGPHAGILFGFLLLIDAGLLAVGLARRVEMLHALSAVATLLVFGVWMASAYSDEAYRTVLMLLGVFVPFFAFAPAIAVRAGRPFTGAALRAVYAAPLLLVVPAVLAGQARGATSPLTLFGVLFALIVLLAWRAIADRRGPAYFIAAFFGVAAQASWSAAHLTVARLPFAIGLYAVFGLLSFIVPIAARRAGRPLAPASGAGIVLIASLALLLFMAAGPTAPAALWGLAFLIAVLDAGLFVEAAAARLPLVSIAGSILSWLVLAAWWSRAAAVVGVLPSLLAMSLLTLVMLVGHAWSYARSTAIEAAVRQTVRGGLFLGLGGHLFLLYVAANPSWSLPPWPLFGALAVLTLAVSTTSLYTSVAMLHAFGVVGAMVVLLEWTTAGRSAPWPVVAIVAGGAMTAFALVWMRIVPDGARPADAAVRIPPSARRVAAIGAGIALFIFEFVAIFAAMQPGAPPLEMLMVAHAVAVSVLLQVTWTERWPFIAVLAVLPAWIAVSGWQSVHAERWRGALVMGGVLYAIFTAYPFVLGRRARESRDPHLTAILAAAMFFFTARRAFDTGGLSWMMGAIPVFEGLVLALLLRQLLTIESEGERDLGRLALVAGAALAFVTVAIPLQLDHQWITIGWAIEGAALAWLYARIPHKGLLWSAAGLLAVVFIRLALNPAIFYYEPRGAIRVFNWYLYTYVVCAASNFAAAWFLTTTGDRLGVRDWRVRHALSAAGTILLFIVLNIEIADFFATGPEIMFRFGVTVAQDLTYTIGWLVFGMVMLAAGIYLKSHAARVAALGLVALTTFKAFLYDLGSLGGLYRVASLVGLAVSLTLVSLALQRFVLRPAKEK